MAQAGVVETTWGPWEALRLEDACLSVMIVPAVGGRVVSLLDRRSRREWLLTGAPPSPDELARWAEQDAVFGGRESFGWDECLPSVSVCPDPTDPDGPPLRDHGDQWGRTTELAIDAGALVTTWTRSRWPVVLQRRLSLPALGILRADYSLVSHAGRDLPILWSAHPVLSVPAGTRVELPVDRVRLTGALGWPFTPSDEASWPCPVRGIDLSVIHPVETRAAAKLYAPAPWGRVVTPDGDRLEVAGDGGLAASLGVWLGPGGWPVAGPPVHQTALEPTGSPDDQVTEAVAHAREWTLVAGGTLAWSMTFSSAPGPS